MIINIYYVIIINIYDSHGNITPNLQIYLKKSKFPTNLLMVQPNTKFNIFPLHIMDVGSSKCQIGFP